MKINSIINSIQQSKIIETEKEKDKDKEKLRPIMSYYIINNHIYSNNFNTHQNSKFYLNKKKDNINIANFHNLNININTNTSSKPHRLYKNNSTLSSCYPLMSNKIPIKQNINPKLSQENSPKIKRKISFNSKNDLNSGKNTKRYKKKIKLDSSLLIKKISKQKNLKSTNDIFCNDNSLTLHTENRKKNKKTVGTTINTSKNSSIEKIKIK